VSAANLQALDQAGYEYLVGLHRERVPDLAARAPQDLSAYRPAPHKVLVYESAGETPNLRYVCCYSPGRAEEERQVRQARIDRAQAGLTKLAAQVAAGRLKRQDKILPRVTAHLRDAHAAKYFQYEVDEGRFQFELNEARLAQEREREGRYFLLTNAPRFSPEEAVEAYFTLQEVERAFREMKDFLKVRPIYHWTDERVRAHIFVCVLAYLLERSLSHQLRAARVELSPRAALDWVSRIHAAENVVGGQTIWTISRPAPPAYEVLKAVGIEALPAVLRPEEAPAPTS
jgi:transposase